MQMRMSYPYIVGVQRLLHAHIVDSARLNMATGKIRADINFINPYPCAKIRARALARNPQRVENDTRTRYPRIPAYPLVRPHTRKF